MALIPSQVERQPCEEYVHDVVDDEELDAQCPELTGTEKTAPGSRFLFCGEAASFIDECCFFLIDIRAVLWIVLRIAVPDPGEDASCQTEDDEDSMPAKSGDESDGNHRADDGSEESAQKDGAACLAFFILVEPVESRLPQRRENRTFTKTESQADSGKACLALSKSGERCEDRPPEYSAGAGFAQAETFSEHAARDLHQRIACEEASLEEAHIHFIKAKFLHNDRGCDGQIDQIGRASCRERV